MIDQGLHLFHKTHRVWQLDMMVEGGFIFPARINVEESRILSCAEGVDRETAGLLPGWAEYFLDSRGDCILFAFLSVKASEDEEF